MAQQTPTGSNERQTTADDADRRTQELPRELQVQKATKYQDKQGKRGPQAAVMGWQGLPASCNRAISKKLQVVDAQAFQSCSTYASKTRKKYTRKRGMRWPA